MRIRLTILLVVIVSVWAFVIGSPARTQAQAALVHPITTAVISGTGAAVQISLTGQGRWVQVIAATTNGANVVVGDSATSATRGLPLLPGNGFFMPPLSADTRESVQQHLYLLSSIYVYVANGDSVNVLWAN